MLAQTFSEAVKHVDSSYTRPEQEPIAICFHWWEHRRREHRLLHTACVHQGRGDQDLELGAAKLPMIPLATSLTPVSENLFCDNVHLP